MKNTYNIFTPAFNRSNIATPNVIPRILNAIKISKLFGNAEPVVLENRKGRPFLIVQYFPLTKAIQISEYAGKGFVLYPDSTERGAV